MSFRFLRLVTVLLPGCSGKWLVLGAEGMASPCCGWSLSGLRLQARLLPCSLKMGEIVCFLRQ